MAPCKAPANYIAAFMNNVSVIVGVLVVVVVVEVAGISLTTTLDTHYHLTFTRHPSAVRPTLFVSLPSRFGP